MKRRILLIVAMIAALTCILALSVSAVTTPDASKGTVTLSDGTVCPLYDTNGNALIWYVSSYNTDDGYEKYDFIRADSGNGEEDYEGGTVYFKTSWKGSAATNSKFPESANAITLYEVEEYRIVDKNGNSISVSNVIIFNIKDDDVKSNEATNSDYLNRPVNCIKKLFNDNDTVEYIYLHSSTAALQEKAIYGCDNLRYINFEDLVNLRQIDFGSSCANNPLLFLNGTCDLSKTSIVTIKNSSAMASNRYSELILPRTLTTLGAYPFEKNPNLKRVVFNSAVNSISGNYHFNECTSLEIVEGFGNLEITYIPESMFEKCYALSSIEIPDTVESIGPKAFMYSGLKEVVIPNSVKTIGQNAFKYCDELTTVTIGSGVTTFGGYDVFNSCPKLTTIYMPAGITGSDFRNIFLGSDALTTVYFIGTSDELTTFSNALAAREGNTSFTNLTPISVDAYDALENKAGSYVIYDYSACEAYNNGIHKEIGEGGNACYIVECKNCTYKNKYIGNDLTHNMSSVYAYVSYFANGTITSTCANEGCIYHGETPKVDNETLTPFFNSLVYSTKEDNTVFGIYVEYKINQDAIALYTELSGKEISYGVLVDIELNHN